MAAVVNYSPPWWVNLLHRLPHFNIEFQVVSSDFRPEDSEYQKSILLLGSVALLCLGLDLIFLLFYSFWLCCRRRKRDDSSHSHTHSQQPSPDCCCTAWCVIIATLVCSAGIAVGFYGNGESSDGANRLAYSLRHANRTVSGVEKLVTDSALALNQTVEESLVQLETAYQEQKDYVSIVQKLQGQLDELVRLMVDVPFWSNTDISLEDLARKTEAFDFYRWLGYLGLLLFDVLICLLVLFGLIRNSRGTLIGVCLLGVLTLIISWGSLGMELAVAASASDFCVSPDTYITRVTKENAVIDQGTPTMNYRTSDQTFLQFFVIPKHMHESQNANFQNPRCENTPLIGRESPPPSYTSSMRAKYLATNRPDQNRRSVPNDQLDPGSRPHPTARPQSSVH
ncbi:protein tweety homolog 3-like [Notothenia coriiceps]|uniref:Protein tweety homolog n=1 Tax=Notothenia coriiceps TaxID=8208 RepID=A0A6I9MIA5_9TELE|nr:PREDICTED: protein tweety homolog 3-like [Notothenia coriiceps]